MNNRKEYIKRDKFDFDLGYFVKSPCIQCPNKENLPKCHSGCELIGNIHQYLAPGISSFKSR